MARTRNAHAEVEIIAYMKAHPGKILAIHTIANGVPCGVATVSKVLARSGLPGLERLAPGRWRYDPPTYGGAIGGATGGTPDYQVVLANRPPVDSLLTVVGYDQTGRTIARHEDGRLYIQEPL